MKIEQIAIRQEIRQMLNEANINKNTLKAMTKEVLGEEIRNAIKQSLNETNIAGAMSEKVKQCVEESSKGFVRDEIHNRVNGLFGRMTISINIEDNTGQSILSQSNTKAK